MEIWPFYSPQGGYRPMLPCVTLCPLSKFGRTVLQWTRHYFSCLRKKDCYYSRPRLYVMFLTVFLLVFRNTFSFKVKGFEKVIYNNVLKSTIFIWKHMCMESKQKLWVTVSRSCRFNAHNLLVSTCCFSHTHTADFLDA